MPKPLKVWKPALRTVSAALQPLQRYQRQHRRCRLPQLGGAGHHLTATDSENLSCPKGLETGYRSIPTSSTQSMT